MAITNRESKTAFLFQFIVLWGIKLFVVLVIESICWPENREQKKSYLIDADDAFCKFYNSKLYDIKNL